MMEEKLLPVEDDPEAGTMARFDDGPQVGEEGFDLAPVDIGAYRVMVDRLQKVEMLVAHGFSCAGRR